MNGVHVRSRRAAGLGYFQVLPDEVICNILELLSPIDLGVLSCVSSVFYIFCNEDPLWMKLCLQDQEGLIKFFGTWKNSTLRKLKTIGSCSITSPSKRLQFDGFSSIFLYRRWYRCNADLRSFGFDCGIVHRRHAPSPKEFTTVYDGKKPVLLSGLVDAWPAMQKWTIDYLVKHYGDCTFKVSQNGPNKVVMHFKDYASYMTSQHDEDPLYIFDPKFGEIAPGLLEDYEVPEYFREDLFTSMDERERPPFRWLVIGPTRSGASWHVDPALTSAWNTLVQGHKRWALYPPGRVPPGVAVHADEEDGDVDVESPTSLQWWLDVYPILKDEDKPLECVQLPGETIYVPSGWWHCVLNLDNSVAVTQNFVNLENFELVCLDLVPGCHHRGVARAGQLALEGHARTKPLKDSLLEKFSKSVALDSKENGRWEFSADFLAMCMKEQSNNFVQNIVVRNYSKSQSLRKWLRSLWFARTDLRPQIWKGASIAFNAASWLDKVVSICKAHGLPLPSEDEQLPVGNGSSPVFLIEGYAVKIYLDGAAEKCIDGLVSELQFYSQLNQGESVLRPAIPELFASGILYLENGTFTAVPWDGKGDVPNKLAQGCDFKGQSNDSYSCGFWRTRWTQAALNSSYLDEEEEDDDSVDDEDSENDLTDANDTMPSIYPYLVMGRCKGEDFGHMRSRLKDAFIHDVAAKLGEHMRSLHSLPLPLMPSLGKAGNGALGERRFQTKDPTNSGKPQNGYSTTVGDSKGWEVPREWEYFTSMIRKQRKNIRSRLQARESAVPEHLLSQLDDYLPLDPVLLAGVSKMVGGAAQMGPPVWLHMDVNDENLRVLSGMQASNTRTHTPDTIPGESESLRGCYILDFGDVALGDPLYELVSIHLDVFQCNLEHLRTFLQSYRLPLTPRVGPHGLAENNIIAMGLPYRAMCYSILHEENALGAIFKNWKHLKKAGTWKEVEKTVWGVLDEYGMAL